MKLKLNRTSLAQAHAASLETKLALGRWGGMAHAMPQSIWQRATQQDLLDWLAGGGFATADPGTKTAAKGRRSLASQRDSIEEFEFSLLRIRDAAE